MRHLLPHLVIALGILLRLALAPHVSHQGDENAIGTWQNELLRYGAAEFYAHSGCNYPPVHLYVAWVTGKLAQAAGLDISPCTLTSRLLLKLPQIAADVGIIYLVWFGLLGPGLSGRARLLWAVFLAFNPAWVFCSGLWGQVDVLCALGVMAALVAFHRGRPVVSLCCFALSLLVKPLYVISLPVLVIAVVRRYGLRALGLAALGALAVTALVMLPFNVHQSPLLLLEVVLRPAGVFKTTSLNAFNLWAAVGMWKSSLLQELGLSYFTWGMMMLAVAYLPALGLIWRHSDSGHLMAAVTLAQLAFFLFPTEIHERYAYYATVPIVAWAALDARVIPWAIVLACSAALNLHYRVRVPGERAPGIVYLARLHDAGVTMWLCLAANLLVFGFGWLTALRTRPQRPVAVSDAGPE
jgi:Gpi18-like mannosyltransferase